MSRTITGKLRHFVNNEPLANTPIIFRLKTDVATEPGEAFPTGEHIITTDINGDLPAGFALAVPPTGAWRYSCKISGNRAFDFYLEAGAAMTIDEVIALAGFSGTEPSPIFMPSPHADKHDKDGSDPIPPASIGAMSDDFVFYAERYASIQLAINAASTAGGGTVLLKNGTYSVSISAGLALSIPDNIIFDGNGATIQINSTTAGDVIRLDSAENVTIRDLNIVRTGVPAGSLATNGITLQNESRNVLISNVHVDGCARGFQIGLEGTTACENITLRDCSATHSVTATNNTSRFGLCVDDANSVTVDNCLFTAHWLDGIKLRTLSRNVRLVNVKSNANGLSYASGSNGNGIDAYFGGGQFQVIGGEYSYNGGSGIYIKTGVQNESGGGGAKINNISITGPTCEYNYGGGGLDLNQVSAGSDNPLVAQVTVNGGQYNFNGQIGGAGESSNVGIYIRARNVVLNGVVCRNNEREGITIRPESFNISIHNALIVANGQALAGAYSGLAIAGKSVTVYGGIFDGANDDFAANEADLAAATEYHKHGIFILDTADQIRIFHPTITRTTLSPQIFSAMTTGTCVIEQAAQNALPEGGRFGGPGSKFTRTETGDMWVKQTGYGVTGWVRVFPYFQAYSRTVSQLPAASTLTGAIAFASNGRKDGEGVGAGTGVLVYSDGTSWISVDTATAVAV